MLLLFVSHLRLITGRTNPVLNGADVARDFTRIAFGIVQNCSELFRMVWNCLSLSTFCESLMEIIVYALNKPAERRHQSHQTDEQTDN